MPYKNPYNPSYNPYPNPYAGVPPWPTGAAGGYGGYSQIQGSYRGLTDIGYIPPAAAAAADSGPNYSQLGSMLAQLGLTKLASTFSGPFAPLISMGLQYGLQRLLGSGAQDELRKATAIRMNAQNQAIPILQAQALGQPTAATRAIQEQVRQQTAATQQAQAMSAGRANQYGTAVARGNQYRADLEQANALAMLLGQQQQQALSGLMGLPAVQTQQLLAQQDMLAKSNIGTYIQKLMAVPYANMTDTQRKIMRMYEWIQDAMTKLEPWLDVQPQY